MFSAQGHQPVSSKCQTETRHSSYCKTHACASLYWTRTNSPGLGLAHESRELGHVARLLYTFVFSSAHEALPAMQPAIPRNRTRKGDGGGWGHGRRDQQLQSQRVALWQVWFPKGTVPPSLRPSTPGAMKLDVFRSIRNLCQGPTGRKKQKAAQYISRWIHFYGVSPRVYRFPAPTVVDTVCTGKSVSLRGDGLCI